MSTLQTLNEKLDADCRAGAPCVYFENRGEWFIVAARHRDSDLLERANFAAMQKLLGDRGTYIERFQHWAVGWLEYLLVSPRAKAAIAKAETALAYLTENMALDEALYSEMQWAEFIERAERELKPLSDDWRAALDVEIGKNEFCSGDECSEAAAIMAAREALSN